jgi:hypothetical protein
VEREAVDQTQAVLELRCGGCGTWRRIMTSAGAARLLDLRIERQCRVIRDAAERLERARMASDADAFRAALRSEIDGAEDFLARTRATSSL